MLILVNLFYGPFKSLFDVERIIAPHKSVEFQVTFRLGDIFGLEIDPSWTGKDHAGPAIEIGLFGLTARLSIYDHRHWNFKENRWHLASEDSSL